MRIAVDAMGSDHGCGVIIAGVKRALEEMKEISAIYLVGNKADIHAALPPRGFRDHRVRIIHTTEVIEMDEEQPIQALRKKKDSSISRAAELVSEGKADAGFPGQHRRNFCGGDL
jgi:glycerol-3-phosphate acyltransferase PlsX